MADIQSNAGAEEYQQLMVCHWLSNTEAYLQNFSFYSLTEKSYYHVNLSAVGISTHFRPS
jgi:hypothetical protein